MFILGIILAVLLYRVISRPATGPFSRQVQLIWESLLGKIVIVALVIILIIL